MCTRTNASNFGWFALPLPFADGAGLSDRVPFVIERLGDPTRGGAGSSAARAGEKVIVEHTAINPNKAAHVGHLRNSALGDTLVRALNAMPATNTRNRVEAALMIMSAAPDFVIQK